MGSKPKTVANRRRAGLRLTALGARPTRPFPFRSIRHLVAGLFAASALSPQTFLRIDLSCTTAGAQPSRLGRGLLTHE